MLCVVAGIFSACQTQKDTQATTAAPMKNQLDSVSYALGAGMAKNLKKQQIDTLNTRVFYEALITGMQNEKEVLIKEDERNLLLQNYFNGIQQQAIKKAKAKETAFLSANKNKQGVEETESGLQYKVLTKGNTGKSPSANDKVEVHYTGRLLDGTVFDSSVERGQPAVFGVSQVIPGWTEALQLMEVGDRYELYIPSELAYGARGAGRDIPPHTMLIFEVELLSIK